MTTLPFSFAPRSQARGPGAAAEPPAPGAPAPAAGAAAMAGALPRPLRTVSTLLTTPEQQRVEIASEGWFRPLHAEDGDELLEDVRSEPVSAVLVSVTRYQPQLATPLARVVRDFPGVPVVALVAEAPPHLGQALLALGQHGVRALVDVRYAAGWRDLRRVVHLADAMGIEQVAVRRVQQELPAETPDDARTFLAGLFRLPYEVTTIRQVADALGIAPTTLMSRFYRAKLPPPKQYLAYARLVRAASLLENPGRSLTQVAHQLEYSSPQSFARHVQHVLGMGAGEFRTRHTGHTMLEQFVRDLLDPYRERLRTFEPLVVTPPWVQRPA